MNWLFCCFLNRDPYEGNIRAFLKKGLICAHLWELHAVFSQKQFLERGLRGKRESSAHALLLWSWGILKMNLRHFHEIPVFIFLVSQNFLF